MFIQNLKALLILIGFAILVGQWIKSKKPKVFTEKYSDTSEDEHADVKNHKPGWANN